MSKEGSGDSKEPNQEHFERFAAERAREDQRAVERQNITTRENKFLHDLSGVVDVSTYAIIKKIERQQGYKTTEKDRKPNDREYEFAAGRQEKASGIIDAQTKKLNKKITSGIKKRFGPEMAKAINPVLSSPTIYMNNEKALTAIVNLEQIKDIEPAADKAIDEIYKITRTKKPEKGKDHNVEDLKEAITTKFQKHPEIGEKYKTLLDKALASKTAASSVRINTTKVLSQVREERNQSREHTQAIDTGPPKTPEALRPEEVGKLTPAAELKKGLSAANKEYWKIRNPEQAKVREAIGNSAKGALKAFKKAVMGSAKDAKQAGGPRSAGRATGQKPEGPGTGIM